jgi:anti-anti-sigma factor
MKALLDGNSLILQPETDLIASRIEELRNSVLAQMKMHPEAEAIVLDATGIEIVDSLGVNLIIGIYRQAVADAKSFEVINAGSRFIKVAQFFRFFSLFSINGETSA